MATPVNRSYKQLANFYYFFSNTLFFTEFERKKLKKVKKSTFIVETSEKTTH